MTKRYDAIIIGAGVGGLICGCYLAKSGMKVLIAEQNGNLGGYCSSFLRKGFVFDIGVHFLGSLRDGGQLRQIFIDLNLTDKFLGISKVSLHDRLVMPENEINIYNNMRRTEDSFINNFYAEKENLKSFFDYVLNESFISLYGQLREKTFRSVLDKYFKSEHLKSCITVLLGNIGLPARRASALTSIILLREYVFDSGYYPAGGFKAFADKLGDTFMSYGGDIALRSEITKIHAKNGAVTGVSNKGGDIFLSKTVIANIDSNTVSSKLLERQKPAYDRLQKNRPSCSAFVLYLGLKKSARNKLGHIKCSTWLCGSYDIERFYANIDSGRIDKNFGKFLLVSRPTLYDHDLAPSNCEIVSIFTAAPFISESFWSYKKSFYYDKLFKAASKYLLIEKSDILASECASPATFCRYTSNSNGALYGWASTPSGIRKTISPKGSRNISGLYYVGHWAQQGYGHSGIPVVAISGKSVANQLIASAKRVKGK